MLAVCFFYSGDAGAADGTVQPAKGAAGQVDGGLDGLFVGDIGLGEASVAAKGNGGGLAGCGIDIGDDDVAAGFDQALGCGGAQAGAAAADEEGFAVDLHGWFSWIRGDGC